MALTKVSGSIIGTETVTNDNISDTVRESFGSRNRIINGDMRIDQRNAGASVATDSGTVTRTLDRWNANHMQTNKYTVQQNVDSITPPAGFTHYLGVTSSSAYSVVDSDFFMVNQRIEGVNCADLSFGTADAKTVTLSFWVRSSLTGTFGGSLRNSAGDRSYPFTYIISSANTWEYKTITIVGDTTGTWLTNNGIGIFVSIGLGVGSTYSGTAGTWNSNNNFSATGATSVVGTNGATFYITGVQLEVGSVATPFERRPFGQELALCQRYFVKTYDQDVVPGTVTAVGALFTISTSGGIAQVPWCLPVEMRDNPTVTVYNGATGGTGTWRDGGGSNRTVTANGVGTRNVSFQSLTVAASSSLYGHGIAESEL